MPRDLGTHSAYSAGVVLPLRSFAHGKARLAAHLGEARREAFVREMADRVARAAAPLPVVVVSSAPEVVEWAGARDLECISDRGSLDAAASAGRDRLRARGLERAVIAHGDLPLVESFD